MHSPAPPVTPRPGAQAFDECIEFATGPEARFLVRFHAMCSRARRSNPFRWIPLRSGRLGIRVLAATGAAACGALLVACGSGGSSTTKVYLDIPRVERSIKRSILAQRNLHATVVCPTHVLQKPGKFICIATTYSVKKPHREIRTPFLVTIQNTKGYVTYVGK